MKNYSIIRFVRLAAIVLSCVAASTAFAGSSGDNTSSDCADADHGLTTHYTYLASSGTANAFSDQDNLVFPAASVPDVMRVTKTTDAFQKGDLVMYFNRGDLCMTVSRDHGETWDTPQNVLFTGLRNDGGVVDPSAIQLRNGKIRLFFYGPSESGGDPAQIPGDHVIFSAVSPDGMNFTVQRKRRYAAENITDPEVVRLGDVWLLYTSQGQTTHIATSADGKRFTDTGVTWNGGGIPGAYVHDSVVDIFGCSGSGITTSRATDGIHFGSTTTVFSSSQTVCDPSPVKLRKYSFGLIYKKVVDAE